MDQHDGTLPLGGRFRRPRARVGPTTGQCDLDQSRAVLGGVVPDLFFAPFDDRARSTLYQEALRAATGGGATMPMSYRTSRPALA